MPSIGTISITSATNFTANRSFTGTSASDDDLDITGSVAPTFTEFYLNPQGDLTYAVYAPTIARSGAYTLSWDNPNSRIEGMMRSGASSGAYNGRKIISAPGDYGQSSDPRWIFGTSGNDVMVAPLSPTGASVLYGWSGDDVLTGGDSDNLFFPGPGINQVSGKRGADIYRAKTSDNATDTILDDGDDSGDNIQVMLTSRTDAIWQFERIGNDLKGVVSDVSGSYNFTVKDQYIGPNTGVEGILYYTVDSTSIYRSYAFKTTNAVHSSFVDPGTAGNDQFTPASLGMGAEKKNYWAFGNAGNDQMARMADKNIYNFFDGGTGIDTVVYSQLRSDYTITKFSTSLYEGFTVKNNTAPSSIVADSMIRVERFIFTDKKLAFDLSENAGRVAKILAAVFGKAAVTNKEYVGIGLGLIDSGMTYAALAELALNAAGAKDNDTVVDRLYQNVLGSHPTASQKSPFVQMLENGTSKGSLAIMAADSSFNATSIGLTGLAETGIEYQ